MCIGDGKVFVFGWNKTGQCGIPSSDHASPPSLAPSILLPRPLPDQPWRVRKVACGWSHTLALTEGGVVVAWGSNAFGQLGMPSVEKFSASPVELPQQVSADLV